MKRGRVSKSVKSVEQRAVVLWEVWAGKGRWDDWRDVRLMMWATAEVLRLLGHDEAAEDADFFAGIAEVRAKMAVAK